MPKKSVSLKLQLIEENGTAHLLLLDDERAVANLENTEAPPVRVIGFNARGTHEDKVMAFMEREASMFGSPEQALNVLIHSQEKQLYNKLQLIRKEARKMAIIGQSLRTAQKLKAKLAKDREAQK